MNGLKPVDIPYDPRNFYKDSGWISMGDWLGTNYIHGSKRTYKQFICARSYIRKLNLKNWAEWENYRKSSDRPKDIPFSPDRVYKDCGWNGLSDWLGANLITRNFRSFNEARKFVRKLKLKNQKEWIKYCKSSYRPNDIPTNPSRSYKDSGWVSMSDWIGVSYISTQRRQYIDFETAKNHVRSLKLKNSKEWQKYTKSKLRPNNIPANPSTVYKNNGWKGMGDWLGTGNVKTGCIIYREFKKARQFVRELNISNQLVWNIYCKSKSKPNDIPRTPWTVYKNSGWCGLGDWLGNQRKANKNKVFLNYVECREYIQHLHLRNNAEWRQYAKGESKPDNIPASPDKVYKDKGWKDWDHFLGKTK